MNQRWEGQLGWSVCPNNIILAKIEWFRLSCFNHVPFLLPGTTHTQNLKRSIQFLFEYIEKPPNLLAAENVFAEGFSWVQGVLYRILPHLYPPTHPRCPSHFSRPGEHVGERCLSRSRRLESRFRRQKHRRSWSADKPRHGLPRCKRDETLNGGCRVLCLV